MEPRAPEVCRPSPRGAWLYMGIHEKMIENGGLGGLPPHVASPPGVRGGHPRNSTACVVIRISTEPINPKPSQAGTGYCQVLSCTQKNPCTVRESFSENFLKKLLGRNHSTSSDAPEGFSSCFAPAAGAFPRYDDDELPVTDLVQSPCAPSLTENRWHKRGHNIGKN
jgi:hypothetical protein